MQLHKGISTADSWLRLGGWVSMPKARGRMARTAVPPACWHVRAQYPADDETTKTTPVTTTDISQCWTESCFPARCSLLLRCSLLPARCVGCERARSGTADPERGKLAYGDD